MTDVTPPKRTEKLQIMLDDLELEAIEDWRFRHRLPSRAAAIRELIEHDYASLVQGDLFKPKEFDIYTHGPLQAWAWP